jgi:hypothetical protein
MKSRLLIAIWVLAGFAGFLTLTGRVSAGHSLAPQIPTPTHSPRTVQEEDQRSQEQIRLAIRTTIEIENENVLGYLISGERVENVKISADGETAIAWIILIDPETDEVLPVEPGIAFASRNPTSGWDVTLPSDRNWLSQLKNAPSDLVTDVEKQALLEIYNQEVERVKVDTLAGYLLPWAEGQTAWLSQSVAHDRYTPSGSSHYAFDFYIPQTMFNLYASKAGTVWLAKWDIPNNSHDQGANYLVLQDLSTNPTTYQLYLHLAQDSIPPALRVRGAQVVQGQFIGIADNTGQSTGHHLHFQVHANPYSYWGNSVDVKFEDVGINGGRPRVNNSYYSDIPYCQQNEMYQDVCEAFQSSYISGNKVRGDITLPYGEINMPIIGGEIKSRTVSIEGWAKDADSGLDRVQLIANYQGTWFDLGDPFSTGSFSLNWDMCMNNIPDGPVSLGLKIWDKQGNAAFGLPGLTHFTKNFTCPATPSCNPSADQIAIYEDVNFKGTCHVLGIGDYPNSAAWPTVGDDQVESIRVGNDVLATFYTDADYSGRGETFSGNDSNLSDNLIGANLISSLQVRSRSISPMKPSTLVAPPEGADFQLNPSLSLSWRTPPAGINFQGQIQGPLGEILSSWLNEPVWHLDQLSLVPGTYTWRVKSQNDTGDSEWSEVATFTISTPTLPLTTITAPFSEGFESDLSNWVGSGLWNRIQDPNRSHADSDYSWYYGDLDRDYKDGLPNSGDLTSPEITLPKSNENYTLKFWYRYQTENSERYWDQRWVQISENGGPFKNVLQLYDDPANYWLNPSIDLSNFAGSKIKLRFHFESLDRAFNDFEGWTVDDVEINTNPLDSCGDSNNSPSQAVSIHYGETKNQWVCPSGDVDYYQFSGQAGDRIAVDIDTPTENPPSDLDLYLFLLDSDGRSVLADHDDEVFAVRRDPHLGYLLERSGTYYLKVRSWAHPSTGGIEYAYSIKLIKDSVAPDANFISPLSDSFLPDGPISLQVNVDDSDSGISHIDFIWHNGNWLHEGWRILGSDWDGSDGWSYDFDSSQLTEQEDIAFYVHVYDWAGNWTGTGAWQIRLDRTPPITNLDPLLPTQESNAIQLTWNSSDNLAGIDHHDLQISQDGGTWTEFSPNPGRDERSTWFIARTGSEYGFRLRGVDRAGNIESYPNSAESITTVPDAQILCSEVDAWENDNDADKATLVKLNDPPQVHNFCNPEVPDFSDDRDWLKFHVTSGQNIFIQSQPMTQATGTILDLYASGGTEPIKTVSPAQFGEAVQFTWTADREGEVYLRVHHLDGKVKGSAIAYQIRILDTTLYLPIIHK